MIGLVGRQFSEACHGVYSADGFYLVRVLVINLFQTENYHLNLKIRMKRRIVMH